MQAVTVTLAMAAILLLIRGDIVAAAFCCVGIMGIEILGGRDDGH